jgi:integrase
MRQPYSMFKTKTKKNGIIWHFAYYDETGRRRYRSTGKRIRWEAEEEAAKFLGIGPEAAPETPKATTLREYAVDFFIWEKCGWIRRQHAKGHPFSEAVARQRRQQLVEHIFGQFGDTELPKITAVAIEDWILSLELAAQTKAHILHTFSIVLREAKKEKLIDSNPMLEVDPITVHHQEREVLTGADLEKLFPADRAKLLGIWKQARYMVAFLILKTSGLRPQELLALRWGRVDWERGGIYVVEAVKANGELGPTKTGDCRAVLLPQVTIDALRAWRTATFWAGAEDFIVPGEVRGRPASRRSLSQYMRGVLVRAGIPPDRRLVPYSFRHTYNTSERQVLDDATLQKLMGHRSSKMTDHYDHPDVAKVLEQQLEKLGKKRAQIEGAVAFEPDAARGWLEEPVAPRTGAPRGRPRREETQEE